MIKSHNNKVKRNGIILLITTIVMLFIYFISKDTRTKRGNEIIRNIELYKSETGQLPKNHDWQTLRTLGFNPKEMEKAYPEYSKINDTTFELVFVKGFDPPYFMWNSNERIWKEGFPTFK